jgi:5-(carboxyamino)imidazole ribonucleotide synthase
MASNPSLRLGILGGGQLGRYLVESAHKAGHSIHLFCPGANSPASQWLNETDQQTIAEYTDLTALSNFATTVDVVTLEFENIPVETLRWLDEQVTVHPSPNILRLSQHRVLEKQAIQELGIPVAPFKPIATAGDLQQGLAELGTPAILKTTTLGYDGKGQWLLKQIPEDISAFFSNCQQQVITALNTDGLAPFILEKKVDFLGECSTIIARNSNGNTTQLGPFFNIHQHGILDLTQTSHPLLTASLTQQLTTHTETIATQFNLVGLLCIEWFITGDDNQPLLVNEIAPRPHNSGHITLNWGEASQYQRHIEAIISTAFHQTENTANHGAMKNLLGDLWQDNGDTPPDWTLLHPYPDITLHLYGKVQAKPGRKMGHLNWCGENIDHGLTQLSQAVHALTNHHTT